tara:strand:- start:266 stop:778 length:513 start_codon:yes stop_codon:yes gene_type:complete
MAHIAALLSDRGVPPSLAASAISIGGLSLIGGRIASGYLLDRFHATYVTLGFLIIALAGVLMILWEGPLLFSWLGTACVGLGLGAEIDLIAFLICRYLGQREFGAIYGYLFGSFTLGSAIGPLAMGTSFSIGGSYSYALAGSALGLLLASMLVARFGPYRYRADGTPLSC